MTGYLQHIKENKTISSLLGVLLNAFVLWLVFSVSFWLAKLFDITSDNAKIFVCKEAFMIYIAILGLLIISSVRYCIYRKKPPYFTFHNDRFAYFTITARFATNYRKANLSKWDPKEKIEDMEDVFGKIIPDSAICENNNERQKKTNEELVEKFTQEIKSNNITDSSEQFYAYAPFILVEHYFYFNILNKLDGHIDPYIKTKDDSLKDDNSRVNDLLIFYYRKQNRKDKLKQSICYCVNSNSTDLSQIDGHTSYVQERNYVNNDLKKIANVIDNKKYDKIEILTDNYGLELISDIIFALVLLDADLTQKVVFHARILPAFVSDVIVSEYGNDFERILEFLTNLNCDGKKVVSTFREYIRENKIEIKSNLYWNMHFCYSETKPYFKEIIPDDDKTLVVVKGDLNFRRLLDDRDWFNKKSFKDRVKKLNASIMALRSIKSSLLVDIKNKKKACAIKDSITGIDGQFGSIHFYENKPWYNKLLERV